ncbi:unnamed protein product [Urochloa decumbens]|uniref:Helicase ATP-binding domain-containing protein n=1 Tax=Urochloa decumbens TaxID=240449 RepID=A0ABC9F2J5_9POAL
MEPTKQKGKTDIVVIDLDDEDGNNSVYNKLAPKTNKELTTSELASNIKKWVASNGMSQAFETMHAEGDKSKQIVPYGQSAVLVNRFPLQTSWQPSIQFERVVLQKKPEEQRMQDLVAANIAEKGAETQVFLSLPTERKRRSGPSLHVSEDATAAPKQRKRKYDTCPVPADLSLDLRQTDISSEPDLPIEEEEKPKNESDGLEEYWKDFSLAIESTKLDAVDETANEKEEGNGNMEGVDCNHDIRIHEDLGHVCRVCGMIVRRAESIIDYQWKKASRRRINCYGGHSKDADEIDCGSVKLSEDFIVANIAIHPRHAKQMRPHQLEGFNFLVKNLIGDKPGGCILAHAPGSGKTFMLISFIQSFLASKAAAACRERLLKVPNLLIMDEGHTPRNKKTDVLESLNRVETPRKVVLSGTLFQNHVEEVFNILNLVRPKFLKMESSLPIVRRLMSQVEMSGISSKGIDDSDFTKSVEKTLLNDADFKRKPHLIRGLRELTKDVLHYYKGDILGELPGLVDFSVFLKLTPVQKEITQKMGAYGKLKRNAVDTSLYIHPCLSEISEANAEDRANTLTDKSMDIMIDSINVRDGVKAWFFMNILSLANSAGEKLLAFSQLDQKTELIVDQFNNSADAKVLFGAIKACGEGISLVGASRVVILDIHENPSVTRQAIGRAFRPGQQKKVFVYRLVAAESDEENRHETAFKKEVISKLWFEWSEHCTTEDFKLGQVDIDDSGDELLDTNAMRQAIKALCRR